MVDPIRLFIGTSANREDYAIERIYEYSLRKNTQRDLQITWMQLDQDKKSPWGGWDTRNWSTPFSGFRWAIPEVCQFTGRAIYTDVDMINYRDIGDLFDIDLGGKPMAARKGTRFGGHEFCVMVFDCEKFFPLAMPIRRLKINPESHHRYINGLSGNDDLVQEFDPRWNCLDGEDRTLDDIWQLHFTKMASQPWKPSWFTGVTEPHARPDIVEEFHRMEQEVSDNWIHEDNRDRPLRFGPYNIIGR